MPGDFDYTTQLVHLLLQRVDQHDVTPLRPVTGVQVRRVTDPCEANLHCISEALREALCPGLYDVICERQAILCAVWFPAV